MDKHIIAVVEDMFFASKIRATARATGVEVTFARNEHSLLQLAREKEPRLIIIDLHNLVTDPINLGKVIKDDDELERISLIGFFSHVNTDLQREALAAGYDRVLPRSVFSRDLPEILKDHTITT
jgi:CheY-like chemotaxis protein